MFGSSHSNGAAQQSNNVDKNFSLTKTGPEFLDSKVSCQNVLNRSLQRFHEFAQNQGFNDETKAGGILGFNDDRGGGYLYGHQQSVQQQQQPYHGRTHCPPDEHYFGSQSLPTPFLSDYFPQFRDAYHKFPSVPAPEYSATRSYHHQGQQQQHHHQTSSPYLPNREQCQMSLNATFPLSSSSSLSALSSASLASTSTTSNNVTPFGRDFSCSSLKHLPSPEAVLACLLSSRGATDVTNRQCAYILLNYRTLPSLPQFESLSDGLKSETFDAMKVNCWIYFPIKRSSNCKTNEFEGPNLIVTFPAHSKRKYYKAKDKLNNSGVHQQLRDKTTEEDEEVEEGEATLSHKDHFSSTFSSGVGESFDSIGEDTESSSTLSSSIDEIDHLHHDKMNGNKTKQKRKGLHFGGKGYRVKKFENVIITHGVEASKDLMCRKYQIIRQEHEERDESLTSYSSYLSPFHSLLPPSIFTQPLNQTPHHRDHSTHRGMSVGKGSYAYSSDQGLTDQYASKLREWQKSKEGSEEEKHTGEENTHLLQTGCLNNRHKRLRRVDEEHMRSPSVETHYGHDQTTSKQLSSHLSNPYEHPCASLQVPFHSPHDLFIPPSTHQLQELFPPSNHLLENQDYQNDFLMGTKTHAEPLSKHTDVLKRSSNPHEEGESLNRIEDESSRPDMMLEKKSCILHILEGLTSTEKKKLLAGVVSEIQD